MQEQGKTGCCSHPQGKKITITTYCLAIGAFVIGIYTGYLFLGQLTGLAAMVILLCTACTRVRKCGLVTASVFAFIASASQFATVIALSVSCNNSNDYHHFIYFCLDVIWVTIVAGVSGVTWMAVGVLALYIPATAALTPTLPSATKASSFDTAGISDKDMEYGVGKAVVADDIVHKSKILLERNKLRKEGVPEEEINTVLPLPE